MRCLVLVLALVLANAPGAWAAGGGVFGGTSAAAALAGAVTGRRGGVGRLAGNPAALADVERLSLALTTQVGALDLWFQRTGEAREPMDRVVAGFAVAVGLPLGGPSWLRPVRLGIDVYLPAQHVLRIEVPERPDEPSFPRYGDRLEHVSATLGIAVVLGQRVRLGGGLTLAPTLEAPTRVRYVPGRGETPADNVVVEIDRTLRMGASGVLGVRAQVLDILSVGASWRASVVGGAAGDNETTAGAISVTDPIDFLQFWSPEEGSVGVSVAPLPAWTVSADAVWSLWSAYRTAHNEAPPVPFEDVLSVRTGLEWAASPSVALRAGWAFEPSPVPPQTVLTNSLDGDLQVVGLGVGLDLLPMAGLDVRLDLHLRAHLLETQAVTKDRAEIPDADPSTAAHEVDNLGFPGFQAGGSLWQAGLSLTFGRGPR